MGDSRNDKSRQESATLSEGPAGRIVHDERGNAVWNWLKETGRFCIDNTSAMLKRLDVADLKIEGAKDDRLRPDVGGRDAGGGYDPYNQEVPVKKTPVPRTFGRRK